VPVERYRAEQPVLDLARYFSGTIDGWGMFQDRSGAVIKRFHVVIEAHWEVRDGVDVGTLDENFSWSDGTTSRRVWTITRVDASRYVGRADDVVGEAQWRGGRQRAALAVRAGLADRWPGVARRLRRLDVPDRRPGDAQPLGDEEVRLPPWPGNLEFHPAVTR
jgi:hypothetical protein